MWNKIPWYKRVYFRIRTFLLVIRAKALYGQEAIPYGKQLANLSRFYHWMVAELGEDAMQLLVAKYAAIMTAKTHYPVGSDYVAILSVIAHPDRITARFPLYDSHAEVDPKLGPLAVGMVRMAEQYNDGIDRGVWTHPTADKFNLKAATDTLKRLREARKDTDQ